MQLLLLFLLLPTIVWGHGRLTVPLPRQCAGDNKPCFNKKAGEFFDPDAPINCGECGGGHPPNDPTKHVTKQSFVCRISEQDMMKTPPKQLTAGGTVAMRWVFPAAHPGDGGLYVSYDHNPNVDIRQSMKFFKIANFPQMRVDSGKTVNVHLPAWLPPGRAVLRWDWYALHNDPDVEFYANCIDVNIVSSSTLKPVDIPSYPIVIAKKEAPGKPELSCHVGSAANDKSCASGQIAANAFPGNNLIGNGNYRNVLPEAPLSSYFITGPQCVTGVTGNCCETVPKNPALPHQFTIVGYTWVKSDAAHGGGFNACVDKGSSGPPPSSGGSSPVVPPVVPPVAPPVVPPVVPPAACTDDDAGAKKVSGGKVANCAEAVGFCVDAEHSAIARKYCPKTCGVCGGGGPSEDDDDDDSTRGRGSSEKDDDDDSDLQLERHRMADGTTLSIDTMHLPVTGADLLGAHLNLVDLNE